jgi:enamine deaminase RidA (YjgF/YER057c/UK114 family)
MSVESQLELLGLKLPEAPAPVAAYVPCVRTGNLLFISGQLPITGKSLLAAGPIPTKIPVDQAQQAAAQCVLNALAIAKAELGGDLSRLNRVVRVGVFVQSDAGFKDQSIVANGASELLQKLLGERGRHARVAVGVNALPMNASVEAEFLFEIADAPL